MVKKGKKKVSKTKLISKDKSAEENVEENDLIKKDKRLKKEGMNRVKRFFYLHLDDYSSKYGIWIETTLLILNFIIIALFIADTHGLTGPLKTVINVAEISIICVFIVEYAARIWVAEHKIRHFFSVYSIIDLIAILPILVHFANLAFFRVFRILRLFRMLRVLRFQRIFKSRETMFGKLSDSQLIIIRIIIIIFTIILISSGLIWTVEDKINPGAFANIWETMYFVVVTIATVGYGDITPISWQAKAITTFTILSGIALIPWQIGKLIRILFMEVTKTKSKCQQCGLEVHDPDANYCKQCGTKLKKKINDINSTSQSTEETKLSNESEKGLEKSKTSQRQKPKEIKQKKKTKP